MATVAPDRGGHGFGAALVSTVDDDVRALTGEELGDGLAEARGRSGHERALVREVQFHAEELRRAPRDGKVRESPWLIAKIATMHRSGLIEIEAVLAVARHRSFRAAASELSMSPTALGKAVAHLEERLGARLFNRTTRSVALTAQGEAFVAEIAPALATINGAMARARDAREGPTGTLRINSSVSGARVVLTSIVVEYLRRYPAVTVDLVTETRMVDIVRDGFDAGIRTKGRVPRDMIAVPIGGALAFAIVGAPSYFRAHEKPKRPADLLEQRCIRARRANGEIYRWELEREGKSHEIDVPGSLILDEVNLMLEAARAGAGLAYLPAWAVTADLASGALVQVLADWTPETPGLCLYYPAGRHMPASLRAFIDLLGELVPPRKRAR
ncbi:Transcriptional regulator, LysR family protein [Minicystis rosea]|nr:Transcriptional regulator, LysR family protein [Minicystis rosea]